MTVVHLFIMLMAYHQHILDYVLLDYIMIQLVVYVTGLKDVQLLKQVSTIISYKSFTLGSGTVWFYGTCTQSAMGYTGTGTTYSCTKD